jgi:hypothetical protein
LIDLVAVKHSLRLPTQFNRAVQLNKEGLKALTDVEEKRLKQQEVEGENYYTRKQIIDHSK